MLLTTVAIGVLGPYGEAIHVRAVEAGNVDRCAHVLVEHAAQRPGQGHDLRSQRGNVDRFAPTSLRLVAVENPEELRLPHAGLSSS